MPDPFPVTTDLRIKTAGAAPQTIRHSPMIESLSLPAYVLNAERGVTRLVREAHCRVFPQSNDCCNPTHRTGKEGESREESPVFHAPREPRATRGSLLIPPLTVCSRVRAHS